MRVLIIGLSGMGNLLLTSPLLYQFINKFDNIKFDLLTFSNNRQFRYELVGIPIDKYYYVDRRKVFQVIILSFRLRKQKYQFSIFPFSGIPKKKFFIISYFIGAKRKLIHSFTRNSTINKILGYTKILFIHDVEQNLNLFNQIEDIQFPIKKFYLNLQNEVSAKELDYQLVTSIINNTEYIHIGLQVGASEKIKIWPVENFIELINKLNERFHLIFHLFYTKEETSLKIKIERSVKLKNIYFYNSLPFNQLIPVISKLDFFIGNDSILQHLSSLLGIETITIFGPTNHLRTYPFNHKNNIIKKSNKYVLRYGFFNDDRFAINYEDYQMIQKVSVNDVLKLFYEIYAKKYIINSSK